MHEIDLSVASAFDLVSLCQRIQIATFLCSHTCLLDMNTDSKRELSFNFTIQGGSGVPLEDILRDDQENKTYIKNRKSGNKDVNC